MGITFLDLAPYRRTTVGFDRLFDMMNSSRIEPDAYPPYDIAREGEEAYRITMSVAGYAQDELSVTAEQNVLIVSGRKAGSDGEGPHFIHKGIATPPSFERRFQLADFVKVESASLEHGLLTIRLKREIPEALKARRIEVNAGRAEPQVERQVEPA